MNKRNFLKSVAALGGSALLPSSINPLIMYKTASAAVDYSSATVVAPAIMPQVINIHLYGGPSELAGNLTNIVDINANSQNSYASAFGAGILRNDTTGNGQDNNGNSAFITKNGFWRGAGGEDMQFMVDNGYMSVYRTLMKRLDGTRSHRESLLQSFKGSLDIEGSAGVGTKIAATLYQHRGQYEGNTTLADGTAINDIVNDLLLPFVSFEGDTRAYQQDPNFQIPILYRGITLDQDFDNPYTRNNNPNDIELEALATTMRTNTYNSRYSGAANSFDLRAFLENKIDAIDDADSDANLPIITGVADAASVGISAGQQLVYPNNQYTSRVRAAVTLTLVNPATLYVTVGGGLGGWDDHNNGIDSYRNRMSALMAVMNAAMLHIKYYNANTLNGTPRTTNNNIVINMSGDFGRRVNLNNNQGWDHGNNQNLYTFGGSQVRAGGAAALGKVVGTTQRVGTSGTNNQVTEPVQGSYEAEPMSVASTVFSYFGVQNPEILTADDELNPNGVPVIIETTPGEADLF
ncbi:MAG: hypothetical protein COB77_01095 [Gammaproteobacteria bacterium]|nr:MAG: hypothetical protein COB77_01095 [Gammaproteobacteria bacterium]